MSEKGLERGAIDSVFKKCFVFIMEKDKIATLIHSRQQHHSGSTVGDTYISFSAPEDRHPTSTSRSSRHYRSTPSFANPWSSENEDEESPNFSDRHGPSQYFNRQLQSVRVSPKSYNQQRTRKTRTFTRQTPWGYVPLTPRKWSYPFEQNRYVRRSPILHDGGKTLWETDVSSQEIPRHRRLQFNREEENDDVVDYSADDTVPSDMDYNRPSDDGYVSTSKYSESDSAARHISYQNWSANVRMGPNRRPKDHDEFSKGTPFSSRFLDQRRRGRLSSRHSPDKSNSSRETTDEEENYVESRSKERDMFKKPELRRDIKYDTHPEDVSRIQGKTRSTTKIRRGDLMDACGKNLRYPDPKGKPAKIQVRRKGILKKSINKHDNHLIYSHSDRFQ